MNEQVSEQTRTISLGRPGPVYQRAGPAVRFFLVVCAGLGVRIEGRHDGYQRLLAALRWRSGCLCGGLPAARYGDHEHAGPEPDISQMRDEGLKI